VEGGLVPKPGSILIHDGVCELLLSSINLAQQRLVRVVGADNGFRDG
jgi:hypothetical protein